MRALGSRRARDREKRDAERLDEPRGGEPTRQREDTDREREEGSHQEHRTPDAGEQRLEEEPFADEAVQRRQSGNGQGADQEAGGRPREPSNQAAELVHVAGTGGVKNGPGAEEQQSLECGVVQGMVERGREGEEGGRAGPEAQKEEAGSDADEDEADILHA